MYKHLITAALISILALSTACSTQLPNRNPINEIFPTVNGNTLAEKSVVLPVEFKGEKTVLLLGYKQNGQFDIDRWLIGLDMKKAKVKVYEIPTINNWFAELFADRIDNGMRQGIPSELWKIVITVYEDGHIIQEFTGNERPNNSRVILLDEAGKVIHFYDRGFSVEALNNLMNAINN